MYTSPWVWLLVMLCSGAAVVVALVHLCYTANTTVPLSRLVLLYVMLTVYMALFIAAVIQLGQLI